MVICWHPRCGQQPKIILASKSITIARTLQRTRKKLLWKVVKTWLVSQLVFVSEHFCIYRHGRECVWSKWASWNFSSKGIKKTQNNPNNNHLLHKHAGSHNELAQQDHNKRWSLLRRLILKKKNFLPLPLHHHHHHHHQHHCSFFLVPCFRE